MLKNSRNLAKRLFIAIVLAIGLFTGTALQRASANTLECTNINVDGAFTGNVFCASYGSSAGFFYWYYNVYTGEYWVGP